MFKKKSFHSTPKWKHNRNIVKSLWFQSAIQPNCDVCVKWVDGVHWTSVLSPRATCFHLHMRRCFEDPLCQIAAVCTSDISVQPRQPNCCRAWMETEIDSQTGSRRKGSRPHCQQKDNTHSLIWRWIPGNSMMSCKKRGVLGASGKSNVFIHQESFCQ